MLALIPAKPFGHAKQRLSDLLSPAARSRLSRAMLADVVAALRGQVDRVVVCSSDPEVALLARASDAEYLDENALGASGLNPVVNAVARLGAADGVADLMVVHGDLPLLSREEVARFVAAHLDASVPRVTLTPDSRGDGTNLLAWNPATRFQTQYGPQSFTRHCDQCLRLGIDPNFCPLPGAGHDVDSAEDFVALRARLDQLGTHSMQVLRELATQGEAWRLHA